MQTGKPLLEINHLHTAFRIKDDYYNAVDDVSFTLEKNEILAIVGESGSGKSTLATTIVGLHNKANTRISGEVVYQDLNLIDLNETLYNRIRGNDIGMIFQDPLGALNPLMTVSDQIEEALIHHTKMDSAARKARVLELLDQVGIPKPQRVARQYPHELSGGMRQRVMIACAMVTHPQLLIADEPTTALDVTIQAQIIALMEELQEKLGMSIIIITHDLGVVADMADEIIVMYAGEIVERGTARDIFYHQQHPYTWALLQSVPRIDDEDKTILNTIEGNIPDMIYPPKGCSFCTRCPYAMKICEEEKPKVTHITDEHSVACWLMDPRADRSGVPFGRTDA